MCFFFWGRRRRRRGCFFLGEGGVFFWWRGGGVFLGYLGEGGFFGERRERERVFFFGRRGGVFFLGGEEVFFFGREGGRCFFWGIFSCCPNPIFHFAPFLSTHFPVSEPPFFVRRRLLTFQNVRQLLLRRITQVFQSSFQQGFLSMSSEFTFGGNSDKSSSF